MIIELTDDLEKVVLEDSERMKLEVEIYGPIAQFHFTPHKWSSKYFKTYKKVLEHWEKWLKEKGVQIVLEFFAPDSVHKIKLTRMFGFEDVYFDSELDKELELTSYVCLGKIL